MSVLPRRHGFSYAGLAFAGACLSVALLAILGAAPAGAASFGPPLLDVTKQCDVLSRHNATAMSECVVAESEARSEILRNWDSYPDAVARKCIGLGRKARRSPYGVMAKCLVAESPAPVRPLKADGAPKP